MGKSKFSGRKYVGQVSQESAGLHTNENANALMGSVLTGLKVVQDST